MNISRQLDNIWLLPRLYIRTILQWEKHPINQGIIEFLGENKEL